jgi:hypothetical protein
VEGGAVIRLPGQAGARAELVRIDILKHLVEPQAGVQRQIFGDLPFVLQVGAEQPPGLGARIEHGERRIDRRARGIERQQRGRIVDQRALGADGKSEPQGVGIADAIGGILLDAVDMAATVDVGSDAVEHEIADRIGQEVQLAVAVEIGDLGVEPFGRFLIGQHVELIEFGLPFVELRRVEAGNTEGREGRRLSGIVRNLIGAVRCAADEGQAAGGIDHRGKVRKTLFLVGMIVDRRVGRRRIFDSDIAAKIPSRDEILRLSGGPAIFETRGDRAVAAAVDADAAGIVEGVRLGLDVQHARGALAILRRQRAGNQGEAADDAGVEDLPEAADAVRQHDAVDAVLQIGVFVADVQFAAGGGVLRYAWGLQQHLVERGIGALRQRLDRLVIDLIGVGANRRHDAATGLVEPFVLARDHLRRGLRRRGGRFAGSARDDPRLWTARRLDAARRHHLDLRQRGDAAFRRRDRHRR